MEKILQLLPQLSQQQVEQLEALKDLYTRMNEKVNVISRKDIDNIYDHHVLHSLFINNIISFTNGTDILDLGTGGGFPGIPMAIIYPDVRFLLVDGRGKKIMVVQEIIEELGLKNVTAKHIRAEEIKNRKFDYVVCRAVASIDKLISWSRPLLKNKQNNAIPNGIFAWKGGNVKKELELIPRHEYTETYPLKEYSNYEYYQEKYILYIQG